MRRPSRRSGIKPSVVKLRVLALSGFVAATAGVFFAADWQSVTPTYFTADISVAVLAIPVVGGLGSLGGAVGGAVLLYMGTFFIGPHLEGLLGSVGQNVGFLLFVGGASVIGSMMGFPTGIAGKVQESWQAYLNTRAAGWLRRRRRPVRSDHREEAMGDRRIADAEPRHQKCTWSACRGRGDGARPVPLCVARGSATRGPGRCSPIRGIFALRAPPSGLVQARSWVSSAPMVRERRR